MCRLLAGCSLVALLLLDHAAAAITLPHFFSDHMVLQRGRDVSIWGTAAPDSDVIVQFKDRSVSTTSDGAGRWNVQIAAGAADNKGATLTIRNGTDETVIEDILVGEVWVRVRTIKHGLPHESRARLRRSDCGSRNIQKSVSSTLQP